MVCLICIVKDLWLARFFFINVPELLMPSPQTTATTIIRLMTAFFDSLSSSHHFPPSCPTIGYRHVYLEGLTEASIFVHVSVHDVYGKVGAVQSH